VAATAGEAMREAGRHACTVRGISNSDSPDGQQVRSGFEDAKLYRVDRTADAVTGPSGMVLHEVFLSDQA
jgi:hypothetical protein